VDQQSVPRGATVRNLSGKKLGKIVVCGEGTFIIGTGTPACPEYSARYSDIAEVRDGEIILRSELETLRRRDEAEGVPFPKRR
jgi:hypothetical protein